MHVAMLYQDNHVNVTLHEHIQICTCFILYYKYAYMLYIVIIIQLVDINEGFLSLMDDSGDMREDIKLPEGDIGKEITTKHEAGDILVTVISAMGEEAAIATKAMTK